VTTNFDVQAPGLFPFGFMNVRLTDRVAILARTDVPLTISNVQTANFTHNTVIPCSRSRWVRYEAHGLAAERRIN